MESLSLDRYNFYFLTILKELLTFCRYQIRLYSIWELARDDLATVRRSWLNLVSYIKSTCAWHYSSISDRQLNHKILNSQHNSVLQYRERGGEMGGDSQLPRSVVFCSDESSRLLVTGEPFVRQTTDLLRQIDVVCSVGVLSSQFHVWVTHKWTDLQRPLHPLFATRHLIQTYLT